MTNDFDISIRDIKSRFSQTVYLRGLDYYRNGRVEIVEFDQRHLEAIVRGSDDYTVQVEFERYYWDMNCDCPYDGDCKHAVAALLKARDLLNRQKVVTAQAIEVSWKGQFEKVIQNRSTDLVLPEQTWQIGFVLYTTRMSWHIAAKKFYNKKDGTIGRYENLEPWSLTEAMGRQEDFNALRILSKLHSGIYFSSAYGATYEVDLSFNRDVGQLFEYLKGGLVFVVDSSILHFLHFSEKGCRIVPEYEETDNEYQLKLKIFLDDQEHTDYQNFFLLSRKPAFVLYGQTLYKVADMDDAEILLPFTKRTAPITIPKAEFSDFVATVYPRLVQRTNYPLPKHIQQVTVSKFDQKQIVLEEEPGQLRIFMRFQYGDVQVNSEDARGTFVVVAEDKIITVHRDRIAEEVAGVAMLSNGAKKLPEGGWRVLDARAMNWLFRNIPIFLQQGFEILGRENLTKYKVRTGTPNVSVGITSDLDWFDINLEISIEGIALSLKELKKALRQKTRYVRLVDKSIAQLPEDWFNRFQHLFHFAEVDDEKIKAPSIQAVMLDALFEQVENVQTDDGFKERLERLRQFDRIQTHELPAGFHGELRPYQKSGFDWLYFLKEYKFGGCLADDMGLGKTIQALALLLKEKENGVTTPSLVVCPTSVVYNWQREAERFAPELRTLIHTGIQREKSETAFQDVDVVLTTYGIIMRDMDFLRQTTFHYLILDESQKIKNPNSQTAYVACHLKSTYRLVLTGTPVENNTVELWSQFNFINPGLLGSLHYFRSIFAAQIEKYKNEDSARLLQKMIYPFLLRRTKEMVAKDLPEKSEQTLLCELSEKQKKTYDMWRDGYRAKILKLIEEQGLEKSKLNVLEGLTKLRQIANHPALIDAEIDEDSGKFEVLFDLVEDVIQEGHKLLVFSQFVKMLTLIRARFDKLGIAYEYLDGRTKKRQEKVDNFQTNDNVRAFLISLKAGGTGLNLTAADYVIHVDPWWNPAVEMQATDRAHRIGQDKNVFVYKLITKDTVEEKIVKLQERKKKLVSDLVTTESGFMKELDREDVEILFS